jgi:hypothetical protein
MADGRPRKSRQESRRDSDGPRTSLRNLGRCVMVPARAGRSSLHYTELADGIFYQLQGNRPKMTSL